MSWSPTSLRSEARREPHHVSDGVQPKPTAMTRRERSPILRRAWPVTRITPSAKVSAGLPSCQLPIERLTVRFPRLMIDHLIGPAARRLAALLLAMLAAVACGSATEPRASLVHPGESVEVRFGSSDTNRVFNIATAESDRYVVYLHPEQGSFVLL